MNAGSNPAATSIYSVISSLKQNSILAVMLSLQACIPASYGYLRIPIENRGDQDSPLAVIDLPLEDLAAGFDDFAIDRLTFYVEGRDPIPFALTDLDEDGILDHARIKIPLAKEGDFVIVTSDGPRSPEKLAPGGQTGIAVVRFDLAER